MVTFEVTSPLTIFGILARTMFYMIGWPVLYLLLVDPYFSVAVHASYVNITSTW